MPVICGFMTVFYAVYAVYACTYHPCTHTRRTHPPCTRRRVHRMSLCRTVSVPVDHRAAMAMCTFMTQSGAIGYALRDITQRKHVRKAID